MMNTNILKIALSQYGVKELPGKGANNPQILDYFKEMGQAWVSTDETAWCSAFANWVCLQAGTQCSLKLNARSWLKVGDYVKTAEQGDIVVFWRESPESWKGHVAFFIRETDDLIYVLGGNQDNRVCIKGYKKSRLLGYRRPRVNILR